MNQVVRLARYLRGLSWCARGDANFNALISLPVPIGAWSSGVLDEAHLTRRLPFSRCYRDFLNPPSAFLQVFRVVAECDRAGLVHLFQIGFMASFWYDVLW